RGLRAGLKRRHLDLEVVMGDRPAGQPPALLQLTGREGPGIDAVDRQLTGQQLDLALLAGAVTAAGGVDGDAVPAGRVEHGRARWHTHLAAVRLEGQPNAA